ncbi:MULTISPECIES: hypothetical protein [Pseudonocardia]|uniref:DUF8175 domain-containing protein n=2 Tax=Pseudonocardia TaxID=1847 RepID=A0A1Y2MR71_PSEAH|nr:MULTISPECIES: hypothetical protein [Pseudonocardia]OSY37459.1 hypothetical protein BG845_04762 [Pseudonocardia autotrophica]OZM79835.1 hypothetical protein CFP66_22685 [Pseudonocardia sp. MH-G8]TDN77216.1 hypothetical protein C8E95_6452 [Pseudonocardia autotrophica]BBG01235.1 hypothetical protein Pdca_24440 [Pseudonocardia autotrophica]GEC25962.1 hypothetical protein PSA01_29910 [Pseudonocardia saturnea]
MNRLLRPAVCAVAVLAAVSCTTAPPAPETTDRVALVAVPGGTAAMSPRHGPFGHEVDLAFGFSHDEVGAAIAATHIGSRTSSGAGAAVVEATLNTQCWGDVAAARERLAAALPVPDQPARADLTPAAIYFRVIAGDTRGEHVVVSLLADTPQARVSGGYARVDTTLRWKGGDWRRRVPVLRPSPHPDTAGYALLGPTP